MPGHACKMLQSTQMPGTLGHTSCKGVCVSDVSEEMDVWNDLAWCQPQGPACMQIDMHVQALNQYVSGKAGACHWCCALSGTGTVAGSSIKKGGLQQMLP